MVDVENLSQQEPEQIRQQIVETRAALADKLGNLETEVMGTVEVAKQSVQDKVEDVKRAVDLREYIRERPWTWFGGSIAAGVATALLLSPQRRHITKNLSDRVRRGAALLPPEFRPLTAGSTVNGLLSGLAMNFLRDAAKTAFTKSSSPKASSFTNGSAGRHAAEARDSFGDDDPGFDPY